MDEFGSPLLVSFSLGRILLSLTNCPKRTANSPYGVGKRKTRPGHELTEPGQIEIKLYIGKFKIQNDKTRMPREREREQKHGSVERAGRVYARGVIRAHVGWLFLRSALWLGLFNVNPSRA